MSSISQVFSILALVSMCGLLGCQKSEDKDKESSEAAVPTAPATPVEDRLNEKATCDQPEAEMPFLTEASQKIVEVKDELKLQQVEIRDCDGKITKSEKPEIVSAMKKVTIEPADDFHGEVTSVTIGNFRTCSFKTIQVSDGKAKTQVMELPGGQEVQVPAESVSTSNPDGKIELALTDSDVKFQLPMNVRNGKNVLEIKYFGKCLKRAEPSKDQPENQRACVESEEMGRQLILMKVDVERTVIEGVRQIDSCLQSKD